MRSQYTIPAALSFALLAFQAVIPWTGRHFITQDGPSHLYTALVARELLLHPHSSYARIYEFQPALTSNWTTTVLLNFAALVFGAAHAEQFLATFAVAAAFFAFSYLIASLDPRAGPWSPVANFLANTWFLWIGFYNFYLGMALCAFLAGYSIRHARDSAWRHAGILAAGLVLLFFTHPMPAGVAVLTIALVAVWSRAGRLLAALAPAAVLLAAFAVHSPGGGPFEPLAGWAWNNFPRHVFAAARGRTGEQTFLYPAMLFYMAVGILALRRREWASPRGALAAAAGLFFVLYLVAPNRGLGGDEIKIRFAWCVYVLGCALAWSAARLRPLGSAVAIYVACFTAASLFQAMQMNVRAVSRAAADYASALSVIPRGATVLRLRFPMEKTRARYGFDLAALEPLFHADAWVAAQHRFLDASDYQAVSRAFPVALRERVGAAHADRLADLEGSGTSGPGSLRDLRRDFPLPIDYVVLVGDGTPPERAADFAQTAAELGGTMRIVAADPAQSFVRVYRRLGME